MKSLINKLVREWAWRVNNGMPDPKDRSHLDILADVFRSMKYSEQFISEYISQLSEVDDETVIKYKDKDGKDAEMLAKTARTMPMDHPAKKAWDVEKEKEAAGPDKKEPEAGQVSFDRTAGTEKQPVKDKVIISGKDKTLKKGNPSETQEFKRDMEPDDDEFNERNKPYSIPTPPEPYKLPEGLSDNTKFPKRYLKALERMMNTTVTDETKKWKHFSDIEGGAGQISAQAGELMTMMGASMSDEDFELLMSSLEAHEKEQISNNPNLKKEGTRIVTKSWIKSARNTRKVILDRIKQQYGEGSEVIGTSWDAKEEVEAMGLTDYEKNKGFSTDMYVKVKTADGEELLDEVSLKKDKNVNFLNSGAKTMVEEWDPEMKGSKIDPTVYAKNERERLAKGAKDILSPEVQEKLKVNIEKAEKGGGSRGGSKAILTAIKAEAAAGNEKAKQYLEEDDRIHREMQNEAIEQLNTNEKMRDGLIKEIKTEFPLKAVSEGEETMAIGDMSLDKKTMERIFGTSDFDSLKENLTVKRSEKGEPYLAYAIEGEKEVKVSTIVIRQDGRGYGGSSIKFEMKLHPELAKNLKQATQEVYS